MNGLLEVATHICAGISAGSEPAMGGCRGKQCAGSAGLLSCGSCCLRFAHLHETLLVRLADLAFLAIQCEHWCCIAGVGHGLAVVGQLRQAVKLCSDSLVSICCDNRSTASRLSSGGAGPLGHNAARFQVNVNQLRQVAAVGRKCAAGTTAVDRIIRCCLQLAHLLRTGRCTLWRMREVKIHQND